MRSPNERIKTLIVEDDGLNIALLQKLIETYCPELDVIGYPPKILMNL